MKLLRRWPAPAAALGCWFALAGTALGEEVPTSALDPVVAEVVTLLEEELSEPLIRQWLERSGRWPQRLEPADLIALKRAGASEELIGELLARAGEPPPPAAAPAAAPEAAAPPAAVSTPPPAAPALAPPAPVPREFVDPAAGGGPVELSYVILYVYLPEAEDMEQQVRGRPEPPEDLVLYLDGRPLAQVEAAASAGSAIPRTGVVSVTPGSHRLRWAQELHLKERGGRLEHRARFAPETAPFTVAPGPAVELEFAYEDGSGFRLRSRGPVTARLSQGDEELESLADAGRPGSEWDLLCEDVEANAPPGGELPLPRRMELRGCVRWADLWSGISAPPRDAVRPAAGPRE